MSFRTTSLWVYVGLCLPLVVWICTLQILILVLFHSFDYNFFPPSFFCVWNQLFGHVMLSIKLMSCYWNGLSYLWLCYLMILGFLGILQIYSGSTNNHVNLIYTFHSYLSLVRPIVSTEFTWIPRSFCSCSWSFYPHHNGCCGLGSSPFKDVQFFHWWH